MFSIDTLIRHERMSTQSLLLAISEAVNRGETEFLIHASGQHDIGGPLWNREGRPLHFHVTNPGQRVGCMGLDNTDIVVDGPAPADVGWLNSGARITVKGDAGDTAGHCAASGVIYIGGRAGTRSGSLMKHDPLYPEPELWILKYTGSFPCEFMGGGRMVVCGLDAEDMPSVLGERACVGMVGGVVYFRGNPGSYAENDVAVHELDEEDIAFLSGGMSAFLLAVDRTDAQERLSRWSEWRKLLPLQSGEHIRHPLSMREYRREKWVKGGIFSDVVSDDFSVNGLVARGRFRLRVPSWDNAATAAPCEYACPAHIPTQRRFNLLRQGRTEEALRLVLDYSPFPGSVCGHVCPNPCMDACTRGRRIDLPVQIGALGRESAALTVEQKAQSSGKKVAVIGSGAAGLSVSAEARNTLGAPLTTEARIGAYYAVVSGLPLGDYTMTGQVPSNAQELFDYFYEAGKAVGSEAGSVTGIKGQDGTTTYVGKSYGGKKEVYCSVLVESQSKQTAVVFARVRCVLSRPVMENTSTPGYCTFNGYILTNLKEGEGNFAVLHKGVVAEG